MNKLVLVGFGLLTALAAVGQTKITLLNETGSLSGLTHTVVATDGAEQIVELQIHNESNKTETWFIKRARIDVPAAGWEDYLCWGPESDPLAGTCYSTGQMAADVWVSGDAADVLANEAGLLQIHINPDDVVLNNGLYRYYVGRSGDTPMDSVDVLIKRETLGVQTLKNNVNIGLYPNPASDYLKVSATGIDQDGTIKIVDVLGKVVLQEKFNGTKIYAIEEFKNGVYILTVTSSGKLYTKRFVVKHH